MHLYMSGFCRESLQYVLYIRTYGIHYLVFLHSLCLPHPPTTTTPTPPPHPPQVMYGGRAIDDFDRRILKTYMDEYMGDFIFDTFQPFHFYYNDEVDYVIPPEGTRDNYIEAVEALPLVNTPEVFGLHSNAEIGYFTQATKYMWSQLIELQPQGGDSGTGISREDFISKVASDIQVGGGMCEW